MSFLAITHASFAFGFPPHSEHILGGNGATEGLFSILFPVMKARYKRLERLLDTLDVDTDRLCAETRRAVQAIVFLTQIMQQYEQDGEVDLSAQIGYFFKWYGRPYSSRLEDVHRQLVTHLQHDTTLNGVPDEQIANSPLVRQAERLRDRIETPDDIDDRSRWLRTLAMVAYLRVGGDWSREGTREELRETLGADCAQHLDAAEAVLADLGLLRIHQPHEVEEDEDERTPATA